MLSLMLSGEAALAARRALFTVATVDGDLEPRERLLLDAQEELGEASEAPETLSKISPEELSAIITDPKTRRALIQRLVLMTTMDEVIRPEEISSVKSFAKALEIDEPGIHQMELIAKGRLRLFGLDMMRRGFIGKELKKQLKKEWHERGFRGLWALARASSGDAEVAKRYHALEKLPKESLGYTFYEYFRTNKFSLPGEEGGAPEGLLFHDVGHVLTGYNTDPPGELKMVSFEAGYMKEDGFSVVMLGLLLFQFGLTMPGATAVPARGTFQLDSFREGYERGLALTQDLREFNFWRHAELPIAEVRASLGLT